MRTRRSHTLINCLLISLACSSFAPAQDIEETSSPAGVVATFSIVACDLEAGQWGVATQSRVLAVGSIVPFAKAEVGAIATQSWANTTFGPRGLAMLGEGKTAQQTLEALLETDEGRARRQVAIVDAEGRVAHFTGDACSKWAGAEVGEHFCCLGNILAGEEVVAEMARAFRESEGPLAERMVAALAAGQAAGGDRRGRQSAALLVVEKQGGFGGFNDRYIDLRVDDDPHPIEELERLLDLKLGRVSAE